MDATEIGRHIDPWRIPGATGSRVHLVEQAHILNGDHRLVGEGLDQLDLLFGERARGGAVHDEQANGDPLSQERHSEDCTIAANSREVREGVLQSASSASCVPRPGRK
jgi:hypothetical protein